MIEIKKIFYEWLIYFLFVLIYLKIAFSWKNNELTNLHFISITIAYFYCMVESYYIKKEIIKRIQLLKKKR